MQVLDMIMLPATVDAPKQARTAVLQMTEQRGCLCRVEDVALAVSELVTNVVRHTESTEVRLCVELTGVVVRVTVSDSAPGTAALDRLAGTSASVPVAAASAVGRGLMLVSALTDTWGTHAVEDDGKDVWFEVAC